jgi:hypothetical protein
MNLAEWTSAYIDYLNCFKRDLISKKAEGNAIVCEYKAKGIVTYLIMEFMDAELLNAIGDGQYVIVCSNSKKNLDLLISKWQEYAKNRSLKVIFANPSANQQWTIVPYTHNMYSDPASLKLGLKSMFESIQAV